MSVWQTDEKISWYNFKWAEREGYMCSVKIVAETFLPYLDFFAHLGSSSSRVKSKKRKNTQVKIDQVWAEVYVSPLANKSLENIAKFLHLSVTLSDQNYVY